MDEGNKYENAQVMNVEKDEKEIKIDQKLVEAVAKKLKEWREWKMAYGENLKEKEVLNCKGNSFINFSYKGISMNGNEKYKKK